MRPNPVARTTPRTRGYQTLFPRGLKGVASETSVCVGMSATSVCVTVCVCLHLCRCVSVFLVVEWNLIYFSNIVKTVFFVHMFIVHHVPYSL